MKRFFPNARKAALTALCLGLAVISVPAGASLSITPTIVTIEGRDRYADVHLVNPTGETATYEIKWRFFRMEETTGTYISQDTSVTDWDLTKHIVFTPRRVTIEPQTAQKVRLGLRLAGEPPAPGDYRAHLEFMRIPDPISAPTSKDEEESKKEAKAQVGVKVNVGFSIPIIYRVGENDAIAKISNVNVNTTNNKLQASVTIDKSNNKYGFAGSLTINYKGETIGQVKNANIFPEINSRTFSVPLSTTNLSGGQLEVIYTDANDKKKLTYDKKIVPIGN